MMELQHLSIHRVDYSILALFGCLVIQIYSSVSVLTVYLFKPKDMGMLKL